MDWERPMLLTYHPGVFDVNDIAQAMRIILTPEGSTTEERWQTETPYVADLIEASIEIIVFVVVLQRCLIRCLAAGSR